MNMLVLTARGAAVAGFLLLVYLVYGQALQQSLDTAGIIVTFLGVWLFSAYIVLPRVHRFLTHIYLPDYYIGRAKTGDGLLSDPINLVVLGGRQQLVKTMTIAGWQPTDPITPKTIIKTIRHNLLQRSYPTAPVSSLFLFGKKQELAFQKEVPGKPHARHHVRFWPAPEGWRLPGGYHADWLGAATYDRRVGVSLFTGQFTHKIDEEIDKERDYVTQDMGSAGATVRLVENFNTAYHHRSGGGDSIITDGAMPFVTLDDGQQ